MPLVIDKVISFDAASPFAGTTPNLLSTSAGRYGNGALFFNSNSSLTVGLHSGISCSSACGGSRILQKLIIGFGDFLTSPVNSFIRLEGNYGMNTNLSHLGDGRVYIQQGYSSPPDVGGNTSAVKLGIVFPKRIWNYVEIILDFESEICATGDPNVVSIDFDWTLSARVNMGLSSAMPTLSFGTTLLRATGSPQPRFSNAIFPHRGINSMLDDVYFAHMDDCADTPTFLGDILVESDDSTYTQNASSMLETQSGVEIAEEADDVLLQETQDGVEVAYAPIAGGGWRVYEA